MNFQMFPLFIYCTHWAGERFSPVKYLLDSLVAVGLFSSFPEHHSVNKHTETLYFSLE